MTDADKYRIPGQLIQDLLDERGWTQRVLAIVLAVKDDVVSKIMSGKKPVDPDLALELGEVFGEDPDRFLALQRSFDLNQARLIARPDPDRAKRANLFGKLPIAEMIRRGWIHVEDPRDVREVEGALSAFFGADDSNEVEILPHAAKKTHADESITPQQLAWLYRVKQLADEMLVPRYSESAVLDAVKKLEQIRQTPEEIRKVPRILSDCGIRFLIVETLPSAKIDGVCFWLDDSSPVVAMSTRHDRIDNFWFVLRHELEHVIRKDGQTQVIMDVDLEGEKAGTGQSIAEEERVANAAAAAFCVPPDQMEKFYSRKAPFFSERDLVAFAKMVKVHPGLVAGQLRHRSGRFNIFAGHLIKVRQIISPSAIVDGWGDVAPTGE